MDLCGVSVLASSGECVTMHPGVTVFIFTLLGGELAPLMLQLMTWVSLAKDTDRALWGFTLTTLQFLLGDLYLLGGV